MAYTVTIEEVLNGITITPPAANEVQVSTTNFPITISYNATIIEGGGMADNGLPAGGSVGQFLRKLSSTDYDASWQTFTDVVGITAVVQDTAPSLGGNLNVNGNKIISSNNTNIEIEPNGTGDIYLNADTVRVGDADNLAIITSNGSGNLRVGAGGNISFNRSTNRTTISGSNIDTGDLPTFTVNGDYGFDFLSTRGFNVSTQTQNLVIDGAVNGGISLQSNGTGSIGLTAGSSANVGSSLTLLSSTGDAVLRGGAAGGQITVGGPANSNISIAPNGTGDVQLNADTVRVGDQNAAATVTTWGTGNLTINTNAGTNSGSIVINQGANANIAITPNGTGSIVLDGVNWPQADGSNNFVLKTNGSGQLAWANLNSLGLSVGIDEVQDDSTPTLGGNLNVNGYSITTTQTNGDIKINPIGTGKVKLSNIAYPNTDGTSGQVLKTNGSGSLDWADKQDPTIVNDSQPNIQSTGQHWYRPVTGAMYTARNNAWEPINDDGFF